MPAGTSGSVFVVIVSPPSPAGGWIDVTNYGQAASCSLTERTRSSPTLTVFIIFSLDQLCVPSERAAITAVLAPFVLAIAASFFRLSATYRKAQPERSGGLNAGAPDSRVACGSRFTPGKPRRTQNGRGHGSNSGT